MVGQNNKEPKESMNKCWRCQEYMQTQVIPQGRQNIKIHYCPKCDIKQ